MGEIKRVVLMGEIKAMEELREKIRLDVNNPWSDLKGDLLSLCDKVEREIAERYMELPTDADGEPIHVGDKMQYHGPTDADGEPIHVGDKMQYHGGEPFIVCAVAPMVIHTWAEVELGERSTTYNYAPDLCTHHKPRTIEDVLKDLCIEADERYGEDCRAELIAKAADEIRGLL